MLIIIDPREVCAPAESTKVATIFIIFYLFSHPFFSNRRKAARFLKNYSGVTNQGPSRKRSVRVLNLYGGLIFTTKI